MARFRVSFFTALIIGALVTSLLRAQDTEEKQYPKARAVESSSPEESPTPKKKSAKKSSPKPKRTPEEDETPAPKKKKHSSTKAKSEDSSDEETKEKSKPEKTPTPKAKSTSKKKSKKSPTPEGKKKKKKATPEEDETPTRHRTTKPSETPTPKAESSAPRAVAAPTSTVAPATTMTVVPMQPQGAEPEQLTIEKSGSQKPRSFWSRVFGSGGGSSSGAGYRYLTPSVKAAIDRAGADRRNPRWQMIVVHNSGTRQGNARVFDYYHRHVRHMQNGLAYHFVIGNGTSTRNGEIEVGDRWRRQINGGHVHSDYLNNIALGICLVGDFNRDQPTRAQLDCCEELIRYLRQRCGKYDNFHYPVVKPHREANPPRWGTDCPGNAFPYSWFRRFRE